MANMHANAKSGRLLVLILAATALVLPSPPAADGDARASEGRSREAFVVASQRNAPPFSFADRDGEPQGILVEFWKLWAARNGYAITFQLDDLDETIDAVRKGRADFHSGLFHSDPRSAYLDFSTGFLDDTLSLFVLDRMDIHSVHDLAATGVVVGVSRDHLAAEYMQTTIPSAPETLPQQRRRGHECPAERNRRLCRRLPIAFYFLSSTMPGAGSAS